jgi:hypothetical protein
MDRSCRGQQRVTKTNTRSSVLNIATHKKIFLTPVSAATTTDRRVPPLPLSPGREREKRGGGQREREARERERERGGHGSEREGGRREERRRSWVAVPSPGASVSHRWWSQARSQELGPSGPAAALM